MLFTRMIIKVRFCYLTSVSFLNCLSLREMSYFDAHRWLKVGYEDSAWKLLENRYTEFRNSTWFHSRINDMILSNALISLPLIPH